MFEILKSFLSAGKTNSSELSPIKKAFKNFENKIENAFDNIQKMSDDNFFVNKSDKKDENTEKLSAKAKSLEEQINCIKISQENELSKLYDQLAEVNDKNIEKQILEKIDSKKASFKIEIDRINRELYLEKLNGKASEDSSEDKFSIIKSFDKLENTTDNRNAELADLYDQLSKTTNASEKLKIQDKIDKTKEKYDNEENKFFDELLSSTDVLKQPNAEPFNKVLNSKLDELAKLKQGELAPLYNKLSDASSRDERESIEAAIDAKIAKFKQEESSIYKEYAKKGTSSDKNDYAEETKVILMELKSVRASQADELDSLYKKLANCADNDTKARIQAQIDSKLQSFKIEEQTLQRKINMVIYNSTENSALEKMEYRQNCELENYYKKLSEATSITERDSVRAQIAKKLEEFEKEKEEFKKGENTTANKNTTIIGKVFNGIKNIFKGIKNLFS